LLSEQTWNANYHMEPAPIADFDSFPDIRAEQEI
jgi:hypothetical protein